MTCFLSLTSQDEDDDAELASAREPEPSSTFGSKQDHIELVYKMFNHFKIPQGKRTDIVNEVIRVNHSPDKMALAQTIASHATPENKSN